MTEIFMPSNLQHWRLLNDESLIHRSQTSKQTFQQKDNQMMLLL
jgi:hypothetical protein